MMLLHIPSFLPPRLFLILLLHLIVVVVVVAEEQQQQDQLTTSSTAATATTGGGVSRKISLTQGRQSLCQTLWAKQLTMEVGNVCLETTTTTTTTNPSASELIVSFETRNGWTLDTTHLWLGRNESEIPLDETENPPRQPLLDLFPYKNTELQGQHSHYGFVVNLEEYLDYVSCPDPRPGTNFVGAAHATVRAKRSAIRGGGKTPGGRAKQEGDDTRAAGTVQQDAWAAAQPASTPQQFQKQWLSFEFNLMCDLIQSPRPPNSPELRHHANQVPS